MKKLLYSAAALATLLFASCQQEKLESVANGGVTYEITLPVGPQTRGEDGYATYDLHYEVYKTVDATALETAPLLFEETVTMTGNTTKLTLDLLNDQDYTVLFWANKQGMDYFDLTDLRHVGVKQAASNNDDRDAFCGMDQLAQHDGAQSKTVELKRPFAQINIATLVNAVDYDINPVSSLVKVKDIPVSYNVFTGEPVGAEGEVEYTVNTVPTGNLTVNGTDYKKVAMNYALVPATADNSATVEVYYEINTANGTVKNSIPNVPVKKNYRTNIIGNLLTSKTEYTITLDAAWAGENILVNNADEFAAALANAQDGDAICLADGEYDLPASLFAQASSGTFTFEGNGVDTEVNGARNSNANAPGVYANGKHLVFKDLTYVTPNNGYNGGFGHAASVTFINCTIVGQYYAHSGAPHYFYDCTIDPLTGYLYTYGSDCVFEGCTFSASEGKALQVYQDAATGETTVTIKDCDFVAAKQAATWDGKPVTGIDINSNGAIFNVYVENCTTTGFPTGLNSGSDLYNIKDGGLTRVNLWIDGVQVAFVGMTPVAAGVNKDAAGEYYVSTAVGLKYMNNIFANQTAGRNVVMNLAADIDFRGYTWNTVDSHADASFQISKINGNGHTITNFTINGQAMFRRFAGSGDVVVKDITFDGATVNSNNLNTSLLTVQTYQNVLLDNVDVKNSTFTGTYKVAPLLATVYNESPTTVTATLKNCDVENCSVTCTSFDFCTAGMVAFVYEGDNDSIQFENCTVKDVQLYAKPNGYASHAAIYVNDADTDDCFNEASGVTVTNVTFTAL